MSRPVAPGQTVPVPFTLSETPDSPPTLTVYQSTAAGVLSDVSATTSPTVTLLSGLAYNAFFTVPAAAVHGSAYLLLVSVTIAGETTTHWLDGGTVLLTATTNISTTSYALKADVQAWNGLENAVSTKQVYERLPGGSVLGGGIAVPYVGSNVVRYGGVEADYFVHEDAVAQTVELHSHVHGMSEDSGIASQASVDAIPKVGRTTRHRNVTTGETADVILEEVP